MTKRDLNTSSCMESFKTRVALPPVVVGVGEGMGDWGYTINCPATVLRSCRYCRIEDIITIGERRTKYGLHDFEVSEALITCPKQHCNSQSGAGLGYYILKS